MSVIQTMHWRGLMKMKRNLKRETSLLGYDYFPSSVGCYFSHVLSFTQCWYYLLNKNLCLALFLCDSIITKGFTV